MDDPNPCICKNDILRPQQVIYPDWIKKMKASMKMAMKKKKKMKMMMMMMMMKDYCGKVYYPHTDGPEH